MAELSIPVRLQIQNLQSLISDLQNKLGNLKVGSAGFKSVQNLIMSIKNEIDKLQIQTSKPFINESQFTKAENSVDKLEDELRKVEITLGRIKFSDLELNPQQKADLKAFEDQINAIKSNLKTVKDTAKQDFLGSAMGKLWSEKFDETAITKSFSQITNNIRSEVLKQKDIVKEAQEAFNSYQNAMKANNSIEQFLKTKNPLEEANLGAEKYAQIFQNTKAGLRFRSGGSTILEEWLKTQLELDDATIKGLVEGSAQKVKAQLEERLKAIKLANSEVINKNVSAETDYTNESARLQQLNQIMQQLGFSEQSVAIANQALRAQLNDTTNAMAEYQDKAVQAARGNQDVKDTTNAMMSQLSSLRSTLQQTNAQFIQMQRTQQSFNQMKMAVVNFMGFNQVLNLTKNAIRNAINHIQELDSVMNKISIVTDMSTGDLWNQVDAYSKMAQAYGVSIKGAYEVSQIYYQQGLETKDVMTLTNETLKLAKISGLDYATTTDYMTTALRGFKMEMSEAGTVVDVYSNLAAHTAVSQEELAVAMSKTASSMESVGATFEESSAMIGTMVAVTRESATNIGSAMKSIASRYGELTKDPTKLVDEEGEAMAFNKVDAALQSVGISMKTVDGQFREFTDVIVELGEKWDQLDSTQQRYIATQFAGNRQQSRFLALVSNVDLLKSNLDVAMNSEDTGTLQALKALDSIEAKTEQVRVAYQQFYTTIGAENVWKGFLDNAKNVINTLNSFPKLFGKLPIAAIVAVSGIIKTIKDLGVKLISGIAEVFGTGFMQGLASASGQAQAGAEGLFNTVINTIKSKLGIATQTGKELADAVTQGTKDVQVQLSPAKQAIINNNQGKIDTYQNAVKGIAVTDPQDIADAYQKMAFNMQRSQIISTELYDTIQKEPQKAKQILDDYFISLSKHNEELRKTGIVAQESNSKIKQFAETHKGAAKGLQTFGSALQMAAMMIDTSKEGGKTLSGTLMSISGAATLAGSAWQVFTASIKAGSFALNSIPWMAVISGIFAVINGISTLVVTPEERIAELEDAVEELSNKAKESKAEYKTLQRSAEKLDELKEKRYESAEAAEEYQTAVDDLADKFPALISGFDEAGNAIIETSQMEAVLTAARERSASATYAAAKKEKELSEELLRTASSNASDTISKIGKGLQEFETEYSNERLNLDRLSWGENAGKDYHNMAMAFSMFDDTATYNFDTWSGEVLNSFLSSYSQTTIGELPLQAEQWFTDYGFNLELLNSSQTEKGEFNLQTYYDQLNQNFSTLGAADQEIYNILTTLVDETSGKIEIPEKASFENLSELTKKINQAIQDGDLSLLYDYYNQFNKAYQQLKNSAFGKSDVNEERMSQLKAELEELQGYINDMTDAAAKDMRNAANLISSYIVNNNSADNFISDESGLVGIISANYSKKYQKEFKKNNKYTQEQFFKQYGTSLQSVVNASESFWNDLVNHGTNIKDKFVSMIKDNENYRLSDFEQFKGLDNWNIIEPEIVETYTTRIQNIQDNLTDFIQQYFTETFDEVEEIFSIISNRDYTEEEAEIASRWNDSRTFVETQQEAQYFKNIFKTFESLGQAGLESHGVDYLQNALDIFDATLSLNDDLRLAIWKNIEKTGLDTKEAIEKIRQEILNNDSEDDDVIAKLLLNMSNAMIDNVRLAIQMASSQFVEGWSDSSKTIKSLSSGLDLAEVEGLINSTAGQAAGLSMTSFVSDGEKLVLKASEIDNYIAKFFETETATYEKRSGELEAASKIFNLTDTTKQADVEKLFTNIKTIDDFTEEQKEAFTALLGSEQALKNYFSETSGLDATGLAEALLKAYQESGEALENYQQYIQWAQDQVNSSRAWERGDYSNLGDINLKDLSSGKLKLTIDDVQLKSAKESINSAYDTLISDVLSKGIENINLDDYTGVIAEQKLGIKVALQKGDYTEFINTYIQYAGKSIDEANDLIAQAIEKDNEIISTDLIKDLQFISGSTFRASLSELKELTNKLDISLSDLIDNGIAIFDQATEEYIVDATRVENLDLSSSNFQNTIRESVKEFFSELASYITNAIKGSLSGADAQELQRFASIQGIGKLDFTETAEGLKISETSAIKLYQAIKKIDSIQGQIVFKELSESLQENNENFQSVTSILSHISMIQKEISSADKNVSKARLEQYEAELSVAQEILAVRSTSEDSSFNFMSNDIPAAQNNPLNYYKNWSEAIKTLNTAMKTSSRDSNGKTHKGLIDYQDYYNIITELNNLAGISGDIELAGVTLNGSMEAAAELIEKGAQALTTTNAGDIAVSLGDIGIDFKTGSGNMSEGIQEGIQELAQNQVDMLDSMISLLETIVAMEALGDLDVNNDMIISVPEIAVDTEVDESGLEWISEYSENYKTTIQKIIDNFPKDDDGQTILDQVTANGHTMTEILNAEVKDLREWNITAQDLSTLLTNFYKLSMSDEFDIDKPWESFIQIFEGMDWGNLTIGANAGKHQIILTDEGQYYIDYSSEAAMKKIKAAMPEWEGKKDEEIQEEIQKIINEKNAGNKLDVKQNYLLRVLTGDITVVTDEDTNTTSYRVGTETYTSLEDAVAASDIFKLDTDGKIVVNQGKAWGTISISGTSIIITSDGSGKVTYEYNGQQFTSKEAAYQAVYQNQTGQDATNTGTDGTIFETEEYRQWKINQGLTLVPAVSISGKGVDLQNNNEMRTKIEQLRNLTDKELTDLFKPTDNGKVVANLGDNIAVTFDEEAVTVDGQVNAEKLRASLAEQLGLDTALAETISQSISMAFEGDAGTKIGQTLGEGIKQAFAGENGQIEDIEIPSITLKPNEIKIDTSNINTSITNSSVLGLPIDNLKAIVTEYENNGNPNILVSALEGLVTEYYNGGNPDILVGALTAAVIDYINNGSPDDLVNSLIAHILEYKSEKNPAELVSSLTAAVQEYQNTGDPNTLVNALTGIIGEYTDEDNPNNLVNALTAMILTYSDEDDPNNLVNSLIGIILDYDDSQANRANLVSDLNAIITSYEDGETDDPNNLVDSLNALIATYSDGESDNPDNLVNSLNAAIASYIDSGADDPDKLVNDLHSIVNTFKKGTGDPNDLVKALVAYINEYKDSPNVVKPTLENLTQIIDKINTEGADAALAAWRAQQEANVLKIKVVKAQQKFDQEVETENEFAREASEMASNIYQLPEDIETPYNKEFQYIPQYGKSYNTMPLPEGWVLGDDGSLYTNSIPVTPYLRDSGNGWETVDPETNEVIPVTAVVEEVDTSQVEDDELIIEETIEVPETSVNTTDITAPAAEEGYTGGEEIGTNIAEGTITGMASKTGETEAGGQALGEAGVTGVASGAATASPSTITIEVGENIGQGLIEGMQSKVDEVTSIGNELGSAATNGVSSGMEDMSSRIEQASASIRSHMETLQGNVEQAVSVIQQKIKEIQQHVSIAWDIEVNSTSPFISSILSGNYAGEGSGNFGQVGADDVGKLNIKVSVDKDAAESNLNSLSEAATALEAIDPTIVITALASAALAVINSIQNAITNIEGNHVITFEAQKTGNWPSDSGGTNATGNFGLADARGTLMGELGPELVVQNGRYFVAGQNGAEFVNLQDDAIVFNHLQTEQLLKKGMSSTRGRAVTNERTAVAFAQGNVNGGPAMASASAALAALKQLRSMWQSLASASIQDLAGAGGGGGGGGGKDMAAYIKELEKWYNWLQKIAELEEKINYQEQLRSTISSSLHKNGSAYYSSLKDTLKNLQEQVKTEQSLIDAQQEYFDKRREELNTKGPFNSLYTFDENGQLKYKEGALKELSKLNETDKYGKPKMSSEEQYNYIVNTLGIDAQYLQTTATGEKIDTSQEGWQQAAVQAFWDKMDADKEEMQSLHDSINEHEEALLAAQEQQNEILQEMRDNQLAVEQNVYDAIVDSRERAIEDAEAMRDAIEDSTSKFIDGLSSALDKERSMYEMQQSESDLDQKRRRLAILQRTGGSNSEIASLQSDIASSERDLYFDKQQEQIDLIQEASDKQIEKLDQQIELDKELLEYQKAHGLLWGEVAEIMKMDSAAITDFITSNNSEWWAKSPVQSAQDLEDAIFQADQWVEFRDDQNEFFQNIIDNIYNTTTDAAPDNPTSTEDSTTQLDNSDNDSNSDSGETRIKYKKIKGNEKSHKKLTQKKNKRGRWGTIKEEKEDHDFNSKGECTKCGYKKQDNGNGTGGSGNTGGDTDNGSQEEPVCTGFKYEKNNSVTHYKIARYSDGSTGTKIPEDHIFKDGVCIRCKYEKANQRTTAPGLENGSQDRRMTMNQSNDTSKTQSSGNKTSQSLSNINLTQDEAQKLCTFTLSSNLSAINSAMKMNLAAINSSAYTAIDREKSTQIGSISLNMEVKQIANDYDAKRAGEQAMEEMLRIARKSTTATIRR